jgi:hypothetical protein
MELNWAIRKGGKCTFVLGNESSNNKIIFPSNIIPFHLMAVLYLRPAYGHINAVSIQTDRA